MAEAVIRVPCRGCGAEASHALRPLVLRPLREPAEVLWFCGWACLHAYAVQQVPA